jgi:hypothetical protein
MSYREQRFSALLQHDHPTGQRYLINIDHPSWNFGEKMEFARRRNRGDYHARLQGSRTSVYNYG